MMAKLKICLDAGHYGKYNRSPAVSSYYESDMSWKLHLLLKKYLEEYGVEVITTRANQANDLPLETRGYTARGCNLFLSIHSNAVGSAVNESVDYPLACCCVSGKADALGLKLAQCVQSTMGTKQAGRITKRTLTNGKDYYGVLRGAAAVGVTGILLEHSFHTNTKATNWLLSDSNLDKLAKAEVNVIAAHYGLQKTESVKPLSETTCRLYIGYASSGDINSICSLVNGLGIKTEVVNGYITTGLASKGDQTTILNKCKELGVPCVVYKETTTSNTTTSPSTTTKGLQATSLKSLTEEQIVSKVGSLFTEDQKKTGVLASVSMAQFLLESAYGKSELAQNANNCFGMKQNLSGNTWAGSTWDGKSIYNKLTKEFVEGEYIEKTLPFRKYDCIEDGIADHSAYLVGAKNGTNLRYAGLKGETNYQKAAQIIKDGGYATSPTYVTSLCNVIQKWNLTKYDVVKPVTSTQTSTNTSTSTTTGVKFSKGDEIKLVAGAKYTNGKSIPSWVLKSKLYFRDVKSNGDIVFSILKVGAITGTVSPKYVVGNSSTSTFKPYKVKVICKELNIRKTPKWGKADVVGSIKDNGVYTIIDETTLGLTKFGLLKSSERNGVNYRDRWISLGSAYVKKV